MILAFDTYYFVNKAKTVCLAFESWESDEYCRLYFEILEGIAEYTPGEFYKRELPCILSLLKQISLEQVTSIIVDGYVFLDDHDKLGLGGYLYNALGKKIPVIGVAKTNFATLEKNKRELLRGESTRPLYITSMGIGLEEATTLIRNMKGGYRIPTMLKVLDQFTKENND
ncbi:Endonuclease V [compost metagenome]